MNDTKRRMINPQSFLGHHYVQFMDSWKGGRLQRLRVEDISFSLSDATAEMATAAYCIANDLDEDWQEPLLRMWHELREHTPPPTPPNVILGAN